MPPQMAGPGSWSWLASGTEREETADVAAVPSAATEAPACLNVCPICWKKEGDEEGDEEGEDIVSLAGGTVATIGVLPDAMDATNGPFLVSVLLFGGAVATICGCFSISGVFSPINASLLEETPVFVGCSWCENGPTFLFLFLLPLVFGAFGSLLFSLIPTQNP